MSYVHEKGVWKTVPRVDAVRNGWKIIPTRWIDIKKGDKVNPDYIVQDGYGAFRNISFV